MTRTCRTDGCRRVAVRGWAYCWLCLKDIFDRGLPASRREPYRSALPTPLAAHGEAHDAP